MYGLICKWEILQEESTPLFKQAEIPSLQHGKTYEYDARFIIRKKIAS